MKLHLNHITLRNKLLLMYVMCVFIPIVLTNVIFYTVNVNNIRNQKIRDADMALEGLHRELRNVIDEAAGISYLYYTDRLFNDALDRTYESTLDYIETYRSTIQNSFTKSEQAYKTIKSVEVYTNNPTIIPAGNLRALTEEIRSSSWYIELSKRSVAYPILIREQNNFYMLQRLNYQTVNNYTKLIRMELNMQTIRQVLDHSVFEGQVYLVNPKGYIEYSNNTELDWMDQAIPFHSISFSKETIQFSNIYSNVNYLNGWTLYGNMDEVKVLEEVRKSRTFVIWLACTNFLLPTLIIAGISRSIHVRLVRILKHMKRVKNQNFVTIPHEGARDEIGQLTQEFNRMTLRINTLINDVYVADIQKKELELKRQQAQLHALHSQINPHFLFNALESIRMRSLIKGETETAKIINNMAKIFRKSISWKRDWVTVKDELDLIIYFLEIQKYRFGDKMEYEISVDEEAYKVQIPKMTFLPFVENASIHGIESTPGLGLIRLEIVIEQDTLAFKLVDNGKGMTPKKLEEILDYVTRDDSMGESIGIKNAYYRLKLCYGELCTFLLHSEEGEGTLVEIRIPLSQDKE